MKETLWSNITAVKTSCVVYSSTSIAADNTGLGKHSLALHLDDSSILFALSTYGFRLKVLGFKLNHYSRLFLNQLVLFSWVYLTLFQGSYSYQLLFSVLFRWHYNHLITGIKDRCLGFLILVPQPVPNREQSDVKSTC